MTAYSIDLQLSSHWFLSILDCIIQIYCKWQAAIKWLYPQLKALKFIYLFIFWWHSWWYYFVIWMGDNLYTIPIWKVHFEETYDFCYDMSLFLLMVKPWNESINHKEHRAWNRYVMFSPRMYQTKCKRPKYLVYQHLRRLHHWHKIISYFMAYKHQFVLSTWISALIHQSTVTTSGWECRLVSDVLSDADAEMRKMQIAVLATSISSVARWRKQHVVLQVPDPREEVLLLKMPQRIPHALILLLWN